MSSTIIYHVVGMRLKPELTGQDVDLFIIAAQIGESNCFEAGGRRARSWDALHWGTGEAVLADVIETAGGCEGGGLTLDRASKCVSPESYIRRGRRVLEEARTYRANEGALGGIPFGDGFINVWPERATEVGTAARRARLDWADRDTVKAFIADALQQPRRRAYAFFGASGPRMAST